jgi:hypothetical protein
MSPRCMPLAEWALLAKVEGIERLAPQSSLLLAAFPR